MRWSEGNKGGEVHVTTPHYTHKHTRSVLRQPDGIYKEMATAGTIHPPVLHRHHVGVSRGTIVQCAVCASQDSAGLVTMCLDCVCDFVTSKVDQCYVMIVMKGCNKAEIARIK